MDNAKILHSLDEFAKSKPKDIPKELEDYLRCVASSGDPVYQWSLIKCLFRQKLVNVISEFFESCPMMDVPFSPNVDAFNYELFKTRLLTRYDTFTGAPFTIQRLAQLLTTPRKEYNRVDKYMRAIEKNIWVVSTREPGRREAQPSETNLVNGMLSNVIHTNNVKTTPEKLKRQTELFDDEEEDEDGEEQDVPNSAEPIGQTSETTVTTQSIPDSPESPPVESEGESSESETKSPEEPTAEKPPKEADLPEADTGSSTPLQVSTENDIAPTTIITEQSETTEIEEGEDEEEEVVEGEEVGDDEKSESIEPIIEEVEDSEPQKEEVTPTEEVKREEEKIEEIVSTEEISEETPTKIEVASENIIKEQPPECAPQDLKRKFEDDQDSVDETPSKKFEPDTSLDPQEPIVEAQQVVVEEPEAEAETKLDNVEVIPAMESMLEMSRPMESVEVEEKVEMVVEENYQAMEVDETSSQSPMAQEDIAEPMEESDMCPS